jgi:hypothetical protein
MRRIVVTDQLGRILATCPHPDDANPSEPGAPRHLGFVALEGQQVHTVEIPAELQTHDGLLTIHASHSVVVTDGEARLIPD